MMLRSGLGANSLIPSPSVLEKSGDAVTLTFNVANPTESDTIYIYDGANTSSHEVGWINVNGIAGWSTGSGKVSFPLVNMRRPYCFEYRYGSSQKPILVSTPVTFQSFNEPTAIHLSVTKQAGQMNVMWVSDQAGGSVAWGLSETTLTNKKESPKCQRSVVQRLT